MSNSSRALLYLIPCIVVSVALNFTKFFETETVSYCMDFTACGCGYHSRMYVRPTKLRLSRNYIMFYTTWTWVSMTSIIPFLILAILNWVIWRRLRAAQETSKMLKTNDKHQDKVKLSSAGILFPYQFTFFDFCNFLVLCRSTKPACPAPPSSSAQLPCSLSATVQGMQILQSLSTF